MLSIGSLLLLASAAAHAAPIRHLPDAKLWMLQTKRTLYVIGLNERAEPQNVYWGPKLSRPEQLGPARAGRQHSGFDSSETATNGEYQAWGARLGSEPTLKATFADGGRGVVLKYVSHQLKGDELDIRLKDIKEELYVILNYRVFPKQDIIRKRAVVENRTGKTVALESVQSGVWYVPRGEGYRLSYLAGRWAGETQLTRVPIQQGKILLESRTGNTSAQMNPWFAVDGGGYGLASEERGHVWFGALGYSGSWKIVVEQTPEQQVRLVGGPNDFDFGYSLKPGERFAAPPYYGGFTDRGFGEASRLMHRLQREEIMPDRERPVLRPVLYNSWYATEFDVNESSQAALAEKAAKLGVELFVMDDGWFGARDSDRAGLGDWTPNPRKFPRGLKGLIEHVNRLGMDFGLWVEPEMVNADSELYRKHPDWVMNFPGRPRSEARNQLILNMAREDVREHIFGVLDRLLSENDIKFLKWDMNRSFSDPGWPEKPLEEQKEIWVRYVANVYSIIDRLRAKHPGLQIEACSGGGGRVDLGVLERVDQFWTSDNTEAFDRLRIQEGFSFAYAPKTMVNWVVDVPDMNGRSVPLKFRFLVAMQGALGIGPDLNKWAASDLDFAAKMIAQYKLIRRTVQEGELYRLFSPREGPLTANQYVSADGKQSALFVFRQAQQYRRPAPPVRLRGLDPEARYRLNVVDDKLLEKRRELDGSYLMNVGLSFNLVGDYDSASLVLEKI